MDISFEDLVRERAYHLWIAGGMADGHEHEHWAMAEQAVKAEAPVVILTQKAPAKRAAKPVAAKVAAKKPAAKAAAKSAAKSAKPAAKKAKAEVSASL
ncbi:hypothetical protein RHAL1_03474 [Beijerinckiaceae bacterium RH AL1]|nr:DUF2934 domain-containing protein [Beijerinckiaceae bacterium]VVB48742.1 hypothetical protein RHCH11_RHCH11_03409 [Beijerinckiaceae bacterium RH CH11]VVB48823.1 hypothetical protein RHAL8_03405 [Beijerinckiaceae bacterium RH AL8]VVC56546.1 hypothetical protein RHAL1_03474 [Beijerinckiaceae bacterium RH AL1]